jgi:glycosyltransferase involved in cell wall biosynthesis
VYFNHGVWHLESQVSTWYELGPLSSFKRQIHYLVLQLKQFMMLLFVSEVIHPSEYASQLFWNQKLNRVIMGRKKNMVLPLSVDRRKFTIKSLSIRKKIRNNYGISGISKVILMLGRADNRKNIQDGLLVAKNLLKTRKNIQFLYVFATSEYSDYSYVSYLSKKIDELQIGKNVKLITGLSVEEIPEVYQIADVFLVLPIHSEMFGLTTLESLYSGTPVFGYRSSATPEILGKLSGKFLVTNTCVKDLAEKLENYLYSTSEEDQEKTRKEISKNAMRNFNDVKMAKQLRKYFSL